MLHDFFDQFLDRGLENLDKCLIVYTFLAIKASGVFNQFHYQLVNGFTFELVASKPRDVIVGGLIEIRG